MSRPATRRPGRAAALLLALLAGCAGPWGGPAAPPPAAVPAAWRAAPEAGWTAADPADTRPRGPWWQRFGDPVLDALQAEAAAAHPSLDAARARVAQARALRGLAEAQTGPRLDLNARSGRQGPSARRPSYSEQAAADRPQGDHLLGLAVAYEVDLGGRLAAESAQAEAQLGQAEAEQATQALLLAAELAQAYFALRGADAELAVLDASLAAQGRVVELIEARRAGGAATGLDLAQQEAQLDGTRAQRELLQRQRRLAEHALSALSGRPAGEALLPERAGRLPPPPALPAVLPAELLQRRPDVAAAARAVGAAHAAVGVQRAAAFPTLQLSLATALQSRALDSLLAAPAGLWSFGGSLAAPLLDGGRAGQREAAARAGLDASVAAYRLSVLRALQEVEDGLASLAGLARAGVHAEAAAAESGHALALAQTRYAGGLSSALEVLVAQQAALAQQRLARQIDTQRLQATVHLAKALGGDPWAPAAPAPETLPPRTPARIPPPSATTAEPLAATAAASSLPARHP